MFLAEQTEARKGELPKTRGDARGHELSPVSDPPATRSSAGREGRDPGTRELSLQLAATEPRSGPRSLRAPQPSPLEPGSSRHRRRGLPASLPDLTQLLVGSACSVAPMLPDTHLLSS